MCYFVTSKKVNIVLNGKQQTEIFKIWDQIEASKEIKRSHLKYFLERVNSNPQKSLTSFLDELNFTYEKNGKNLKLTGFSGKPTYQTELFENISHLITVGNHITLRGEDGAILGWFFSGNLNHFSSYKELKELQQPVDLYNKLNSDLDIKPTNNKMKI